MVGEPVLVRLPLERSMSPLHWNMPAREVECGAAVPMAKCAALERDLAGARAGVGAGEVAGGEERAGQVEHGTGGHVECAAGEGSRWSCRPTQAGGSESVPALYIERPAVADGGADEPIRGCWCRHRPW